MVLPYMTTTQKIVCCRLLRYHHKKGQEGKQGVQNEKKYILVDVAYERPLEVIETEIAGRVPNGDGGFETQQQQQC